MASGLGLEIFDLQLRREATGWVLRVVIDRPDAPAGAPGQEPVGIEDCQRVSHDLSALLDVEDELTAGFSRGYTLEVSSPGLDRPLRGEADYRRFVGRLTGIEGPELSLVEGRRVHRVPLARIKRARLDVEF